MELKRSKVKGFSLIELLVSMAVFLVAVAIAFSLALTVRRQGDSVVQKTESSTGGRVALNYLRRDVINAGLGYHRVGGVVRDNYGNLRMSLAQDNDSDYDLITGLMAGNQRNTNNLSGNSTDVVCFAMRDLSFNSGNGLKYNSVTVSGSQIRINMNTGAAAPVSVYDLLLFETGTSQIIGMVTAKDVDNKYLYLNVGDPIGINLPANGSGNGRSLLASNTGSGNIKKFNLFRYSVRADGVLIRTQYGNIPGGVASEQIDTRELVSGVLDFQIKYLLKSGSVVDDPSNGNNGRTNQQNMNQVVQIEISITIDSLSLDGTSTVGPPTTLYEIISTRNLQYDLG